MENTYLLLDGDDDDALLQLQGYSVTYRIAMGPQTGRKVLSLLMYRQLRTDGSGHVVDWPLPEPGHKLPLYHLPR